MKCNNTDILCNASLHDETFLILTWAPDPAVINLQLHQQTSNSVPFSFSGTSRGPSPVTLASQDALPIAVAFTESVNAYFKGADPTKWVSHDLTAQRPRHGPARIHIFVHIWTSATTRMTLWAVTQRAAVLVSSPMCVTLSRPFFFCRVDLSVSLRMCGMFCVSLTPFFHSG